MGKIYQDYLRGGPHYASQGNEVLPEFIEFVEKTSFSIKSAFDIGVGDGKYLKYLRTEGFKIAGIDSSETAIGIARQNLGRDVTLTVADMFEYDIPRGQYDFVFSIAAIHHGLKYQIEELVARIYEALVPGGGVFVTLPVRDAKDKWNSFKTHAKIAPGIVAHAILRGRPLWDLKDADGKRLSDARLRDHDVLIGSS